MRGFFPAGPAFVPETGGAHLRWTLLLSRARFKKTKADEATESTEFTERITKLI
jgi:hypothetical protein